MIAREAGWLGHVDQGVGQGVRGVLEQWCAPGRVHEVGAWLVVVLTGGFGLWVGGVAHTVGLWCGFAFLSVSSLHSFKGSG